MFGDLAGPIPARVDVGVPGDSFLSVVKELISPVSDALTSGALQLPIFGNAGDFGSLSKIYLLVNTQSLPYPPSPVQPNHPRLA